MGLKGHDGDIPAKPVPRIATKPNLLCGSIRNREIATAGEIESGDST